VGAQQGNGGAAQSGSQALRTPWGDPDLQGIWNTQTRTPFQKLRPGEKPPENEEEGPPLGAPGNTPVIRDTLGQPTYHRQTGNGPEHWYEFGQAVETGRESLVIDPPDGRIPPFTPEAEQKRKAFDVSMAGIPKDEPRPGEWLETADPWMRCITRGLPGMFHPTGYNLNFMITQGPGWVAILSEMIHETRIIPLDGRPALPSNVRQWLGDSRGRWEGDTLVVETTNIDRRLHGLWQERDWYGTPNAKITERFRRVDANTIDFRYTIDDPTQYTRPWTVAIPMRTNNAPDRIMEYACHEGNHSIANVLSGARSRDKKGTPAKKAATTKTAGTR